MTITINLRTAFRKAALTCLAGTLTGLFALAPLADDKARILQDAGLDGAGAAALSGNARIHILDQKRWPALAYIVSNPFNLVVNAGYSRHVYNAVTSGQGGRSYASKQMLFGRNDLLDHATLGLSGTIFPCVISFNAHSKGYAAETLVYIGHSPESKFTVSENYGRAYADAGESNKLDLFHELAHCGQQSFSSTLRREYGATRDAIAYYKKQGGSEDTVRDYIYQQTLSHLAHSYRANGEPAEDGNYAFGAALAGDFLGGPPTTPEAARDALVRAGKIMSAAEGELAAATGERIFAFNTFWESLLARPDVANDPDVRNLLLLAREANGHFRNHGRDAPARPPAPGA